MKKFKIIDIPDGEAPLWVRKEWVGVVLPIAENPPINPHYIGVLGGVIVDQEVKCYPVEVGFAINLLKEAKSDASEWWRDISRRNSIRFLFFEEKVCELL